MKTEVKPLRNDLWNNVLSVMPIVSSVMLEDTLQLVMLVLGVISFLVSISYSLIKTYHLIKQGKIDDALAELEQLKKEVDERKKI